jgi:hypothetical protein
MLKLAIYIGRNIQRDLPLTPDDRTLVFPELGDADDLGQRWPQHAQDTVNTVRAAFTRRASQGDNHPTLKVVTHAQCVVAVAAELVGQGAFQPDEVLIVKLDGDGPGRTHEEFGITAEGVLAPNWPFGWFEWD